MTDEDLGASHEALRQLPPVAHRVHSSAAPTPCPVSGQKHGLGELNPAPMLERDPAGKVMALLTWELGTTRWTPKP